MSQKELIACFRDTVKISYGMPLYTSTIEAQKTNRIFDENFVSEKEKITRAGALVFERAPLFIAAQSHLVSGKTVVVNCADPVIPGSEIEEGGLGQEESLCR